jgi:predicted CXXCH cytochrome family protein
MNTKPRILFATLAAVSAVSSATALTGFLLLLLAPAMQASAIEHPGIVPRDANCSSCHANKTRGKSVHSAMLLSCTVCHLAQTEGDMTTLNLAWPKEEMCFVCHEKSVELQQHSPVVRGQCVDCHDAHSSSRRSLLRVQVDVRRP